MIAGYLIDPVERTIIKVEVSPNDLGTYYRALDCETFTLAAFNDIGDVVFVDDDGLLKGPTSFFLIEGYPQPLAGKGLVLGTDPEGETIAPTVGFDWLVENVDFGVPMRVGDRVLFMGDRHIREVQ